jgi:hypothetical protein
MTVKRPSIKVARIAWVIGNTQFKATTAKMWELCKRGDLPTEELVDCYKSYKQLHDTLIAMQKDLQKHYPVQAVCIQNGKEGHARSLWDLDLVFEGIEVHD